MLLMEVVPVVQEPVLVRRGIMKPKMNVLLFMPVMKEIISMKRYFVRVSDSFSPLIQDIKHGSCGNGSQEGLEFGEVLASCSCFGAFLNGGEESLPSFCNFSSSELRAYTSYSQR